MSESHGNERRYWPLGEMILSRVKAFLREPEVVFWVYGFPILMTAALGMAFRNRPIETVVVDVVDGPRAAEVQAALESSQPAGRFEVHVVADEEARVRLRTGKTDLIVASQASDDANDADSEPAAAPRYEYWFDPTRPQSVLAQTSVDDQLQRAAGRIDPAATTAVAVDEPGGRYIDFLVPGLLGMGLMGGGLWGVGFVIVDMRVRKLLKRFLATPMKKSEFLAAVMISRMLFMIPEVLILLVFSRYAFGVVNHGGIAAVLALVMLGALTFSGVGLLVACRAKTIEAASGMMNLTMIPMWIFSGIFFSSERFPDAIQPIIKALPLTPLISSLRSVMLEGASLSSQLGRIGIMAARGAISFLLALRWFRWR